MDILEPSEAESLPHVSQIRELRLPSAALAFALAASADPTVSAGYRIALHASGAGAISGIQIGPDGNVYAVDHAGWRVVRAESNGTVVEVASGIPYPNGITFTASGRMFVASGGGQAVYEVVNGTPTVFASMGAGAYPTSMVDVLAMIQAQIKRRFITGLPEGQRRSCDGGWRVE